MGYRSQVTIALPKHVQLPKTILSTLDSANRILKSTLDEPLKEEFTVYYWDWNKWYLEYQEVKEIMDFLHSLDKDDFGFLRIGEEWDDVAIDGDIDRYGISYSRIISFEGESL